MACTTIQTSLNSSGTKSFEVFVSFRGEDIRNSFSNHLFAALERKGVFAFRDDQKIKKGELLEPELFQAIEGSLVFIVVFSKDYASSTWCLKELTKIVDWVEKTGRRVLPVFFDVTPSEVRKQSGQFGNAFAEHEQRFKDDLEMVQKWRKALTAITNRCGWDLHNKPQNEEIEKIVEEVINILGHNQILSFDDDLVDMHQRVRQLEELLNLGANEVEVVGIHGMGGIGKTTLANVLFNKISPQYASCCFIEDVSRLYGNFRTTDVHKELLCQALNQVNMEIINYSHGKMLVRTRLRHLKTLIVLDNVDRDEQLEKLALRPNYLGAGSRIIIISRDSHILRNYGVNRIFSVELLSENKALQLFCRKAFKSDDIKKGYQQLTSEVLVYAKKLPLAVNVLGSFLFDREIYEWRSALARLKENPHEDIMNVLRISFDGLGHMEKEMFLDIACFSTYYTYESWKRMMELLNYRGFFPEIGIKVLIDKSLISYDGPRIYMHDLLQELGKCIVREESPNEPNKWRRLWDYKHLRKVMIKNEEATNLEAIVIQVFECPIEFLDATMTVDALSKMNHLNFLKFENVSFSGSLNYLSNELRYISWTKYPFKWLPSSFRPEELVELILPCSNLIQLWEGTKYLPNLRNIDLRESKKLIELPDLRGVPRLRDLILTGCVEIVHIDPSIGVLKELTVLNLKNCKNLVLDLNIIFGLDSLKELNLSGCSNLLNNRMLKDLKMTEHLENVDKNRSAIQLSTSSVYDILMFPFYFLSSRKHEDSLDMLLPYLCRFPCLWHLDLSFCGLLQIPDAIGNLHSLEVLNLGGNKFVRLPTTIKELTNLRELSLEHCKQLKYLPELPTTKGNTSGNYSIRLYIFNCPNLSEMEHCYDIIFSWMIQIFKVLLQRSLPWSRIDIVIPGTQIPQWFSKQNNGSSIIMDLPPVMDDSNWEGVACCFLLVAHDDPSNLGHKRACHNYASVECGVHNSPSFIYGFVFLIHLVDDLITDEIDHLFILFLSREYLIPQGNEIYDLDKRKFSTIIYHHPKGLHMEVKNCGYRWVFKEDLQQLNPWMMFSRNSSSRNHTLLLSN